MNVLFHLAPEMIERIFAPRDIARLSEAHTLLYRDSISDKIAEVDALITGWGTPHLDDVFLGRAKNLKLIAPSAGSTRYLLPPAFWDRGIRLCTANEALGEGVAETTLAMIIAGLKAFFPCAEL